MYNKSSGQLMEAKGKGPDYEWAYFSYSYKGMKAHGSKGDSDSMLRITSKKKHRKLAKPKSAKQYDDDHNSEFYLSTFSDHQGKV